MSKSRFSFAPSSRSYLVVFVALFAIIGSFFVIRSFASERKLPLKFPPQIAKDIKAFAKGGMPNIGSSATAPDLSFTQSPNPSIANQTAKFVWKTRHAEYCFASNYNDNYSQLSWWLDQLGRSGSKKVTIPENIYTFEVQCVGKNMGVSHAFKAPGKDNTATPTLSFSVKPAKVKPGQTAVLSWKTSGMTDCYIGNSYSMDSATVPVSGQMNTPKLSATANYYIACADQAISDVVVYPPVYPLNTAWGGISVRVSK